VVFKLNNNFFKHSFGSLLGQLIPLLTLGILTRIYDSDSFGEFALFQSLTVIISNVFNLKYDFYIVTEKNIRDGLRNGLLSIVIPLVFFIVTSLLLVLFLDFLSNKIFVYLLPCILLYNIYQSNLMWFNRLENYFLFNLSRGIYFTLVSILPFLLKDSSSGLILGYFFATLFVSVLTFILNYRIILLSAQFFNLKLVPFIRSTFKHRINYCLSQLVGNLNFHFPIIAASFIYSNYSVGIFMLSYKLVNLPATFFAQPISEVFRTKSRKILANSDYLNFYIFRNKVLKNSSLISIIICLFVLIFNNGNLIISFLGPQWIDTKEVINILIFFGLFKFIFTSVENSSIIIGKEKYYFIWNILRLSSLTIIIFLSYFIFKISLIVFIIIYCIFSIIFYVYELVKTSLIIKNEI